MEDPPDGEHRIKKKQGKREPRGGPDIPRWPRPAGEPGERRRDDRWHEVGEQERVEERAAENGLAREQRVLDHAEPEAGRQQRDGAEGERRDLINDVRASGFGSDHQQREQQAGGSDEAHIEVAGGFGQRVAAVQRVPDFEETAIAAEAGSAFCKTYPSDLARRRRLLRTRCR